MSTASKSLALFSLLTLLIPASTFAQSIVKESATSAAPVAYVYVSTSKGINLYDAASTGKLTLVAGSPFQAPGLMIGSNGKYFISLGTDYVHSYLTASNGAIGKQASQINTQSYSGSECGTTNGAVIDHTGQDIYVLIKGAYACDAFQAFKIGSNGALGFLGATDFDEDQSDGSGNLPAIIGTDKYAYDTAVIPEGGGIRLFNGFVRESSGSLANSCVCPETDPTPQPGPWRFYPTVVTADPNNHLAVSMLPQYRSPEGQYGPIQLASYSVNAQGGIVSTNTWQNMPTPKINPTALNMSPSGKLLAVASSAPNNYGNGTSTGLQVFHFNGASPITTYSSVLTTSPIDFIHWDNANHLYALSKAAGKLYIFTVTPTSITAVSGSPFSITGASGLFVVPK